MTLNYPCKPSGLYVMSRDDIEQLSHQILSERQPKVLEKPMALDIDELMKEGFYLEIKDALLSESGSLLGLITFVDRNIPTYDEAFNETSLKADVGTVVIDKRLYKIPTRCRFTKAHELSHWILHRKFYSPIKKSYSFRKCECSYIACRQEAIGRKNPTEAKTDYDWSEWQADCLGAALLMPATTFVPAAQAILHKNGFEELKLVYGSNDDRATSVISELAKIYEVSMRSVCIRLKTFGFYY